MNLSASQLFLQLITCLFYCSSTSANDAAAYINITHAVRVFNEAPRGTVVWKYQPPSAQTPPAYDAFRMSLSGQDSYLFMITKNALIVAHWPRLSRSVGEVYRVQITVASEDSSQPVAFITLRIIVSKRNNHRPIFVDDPYVADVFRYGPVGKQILRLNASDDDEEPYNRNITYSLVSNVGNIVTVYPINGSVVIGKGLRHVTSASVSLLVKAEDDGAPPFSTIANVTLYVRNTSEVRNLMGRVVDLSTLRVCWDSPRFGFVHRYEVYFFPERHPQARQIRQVRRVDRQCLVLEELESYETYVVGVKAFSSANVPGASRSLRVLMDRDMCDDGPCGGRGKCVSLHTEPGYTCVCVDGSEGSFCPISDDCEGPQCPNGDQQHRTCNCNRKHIRLQCEDICRERLESDGLCHNGATPIQRQNKMECACAKGYFGTKCESYNPCDSLHQCENGALCRNISSTKFRCECPTGYYGEICERYDPCIDSPCQNAGHCHNVSDTKYLCECFEGHFGRTCERHDPCFSAPCQNNAVCTNISDIEYQCNCGPGFHGSDCSLYNPCLENPCQNGGMCNSVDGQFVCECRRGRFGTRCEHVNKCVAFTPCGPHSVTCHNTSDTAYRCVCIPGWAGENCTAYNPCSTMPCQHGAECHVNTLSRDYTCRCARGYWGLQCEHINHCANQPCHNGASCVNSTDGFTCSCAPGYFGQYCELFNPCSISSCRNNASCRNTSTTSYECLCRLHYYGERCEYYNSCHSNPCVNGKCITHGSRYQCNCSPGYYGSSCHLFDPCESTPCYNGATCASPSDDSLSEYKCHCRPSYYGHNCQYKDYCMESPCLRGECSNTGRSYHCKCPDGFFGDRCESSDPCSDNPCQNDATCIRESGARYTCNCGSRGYYGTHCEMYNPCAASPCLNSGSCSHLGNKEFHCDCHAEYQGKTCNVEVPCNYNGKVCYNDGLCRRDSNGTFYCMCIEGYLGSRCYDFDPCTPKDNCLNGGRCVAQGPMFSCECTEGFFGRNCESHRPCDDYICMNEGTCVQTAHGDKCHCAPGFEGRLCHHNVDECASQPCRNGGDCFDLTGGYTCICPDGFTGDSCQITDFCQKETIFEARGVFHWPATESDTIAVVECPRGGGISGQATRQCLSTAAGHTASWAPPKTEPCGVSVSNTQQALDGLLYYLYGNISLTSPSDVADVATFLTSILTFAYDDKQLSEYAVSVVDMVMDLDASTIKISNSSHRFLGFLEQLTQNVNWLNRTVMMIRKNLQINVVSITWQQHDRGAIYRPQNVDNVNIKLPKEVFQRDVSVTRMKFVYMPSGKLFPASHASDALYVPGIVSASVGTEGYKDLQTCVKYMLPNKKVSQHNRCVFWQTADNEWSPDGVETISYRGLRTTCCSDHLTYFSVVADAETSARSAVEEDLYITVTSTGGLGLAIVCLVAVITTYALFRSLYQEPVGQIIIQLSICHVLLDIFTLVGFNHFQLGSSTMCTITAVIRHYMALCSLIWVAILGHLVYRTLATGDIGGESYFLPKRLAIAWGLPLVPVICVLSTDTSAYSRNPENCFLAADNPYVYCSAYVLPGILLVITMLILLALVLHSLCDSATSKRKQHSIHTCQVFGSLFLMVIVATGFLFNYFSSLARLVDYATILYYTSFTLNGLAGLSVFLSFLLFKREARSAWFVRCCKEVPEGERATGRYSSDDASSHSPSNRNDYALVGTHQITEGRRRDQTSPGARTVRSVRDYRGCSRRTSRVSESSEYLDVYVPEVERPMNAAAATSSSHASPRVQVDGDAIHAHSITGNHSSGSSCNHMPSQGRDLDQGHDPENSKAKGSDRMQSCSTEHDPRRTSERMSSRSGDYVKVRGADHGKTSGADHMRGRGSDIVHVRSEHGHGRTERGHSRRRSREMSGSQHYTNERTRHSNI